VLVGAAQTRPVEIIRQVCAEYLAEILGIETIPDHLNTAGRSGSELRGLPAGPVDEGPFVADIAPGVTPPAPPPVAVNQLVVLLDGRCCADREPPIDVARRYVENHKPAA
jgi:hypothetical protein